MGIEGVASIQPKRNEIRSPGNRSRAGFAGTALPRRGLAPDVIHIGERYYVCAAAHVGSNAASVWWVNGKEVTGIYGDRQTVIGDGVSKRLTLNKGANLIRAAIINGGGATDFCARFLDAEDKPLKGFAVSLTGTAK